MTRFSFKKYVYTGKKNTHETSGDLILKIKNIKKVDSKLWISIYDKDFEDEPRRTYKAKGVRINTNEFNYVFHNLKYREYAAVIIHDENSNNNFDITIFGRIKEGYGTSNYDPLDGLDLRFKKIKFKFNKHKQVIEIKMDYPIY